MTKAQMAERILEQAVRIAALETELARTYEQLEFASRMVNSAIEKTCQAQVIEVGFDDLLG